MAACNAVGEFAPPPILLFPGERLRDVGLSGFPDAIYATTKNGWMDTETFVAYLEKIVEYAKSLSVDFPIIIFVDGHSTHMSLQAAEYCHKNDVILYCLVPNATHIMQPLDIGFFSPMKSVWKQTVKQWQIEHMGLPLGKKDFPALLRKTWEKVATFENTSHGFRKAGLFPLRIDGIDSTKLGPSKLVNKTDADKEDKEKENASAERQDEICASNSADNTRRTEQQSGENISEIGNSEPAGKNRKQFKYR